ncbi:uncharacterized protein LOC101862829 [Aplysia californica]|uniref:Uncharacterized protein LOC101862829 n=1 Tax=Aplysia californica TaxID=6500 RepID=A0ABM1A8W4_APLCA|nr:uncharacterized protein LOC101862829 [Aplysia californica]
MASSIVSGSSSASNQPRGYSVQPAEKEVDKPRPTMTPFYDEDTKISFSCQNSTLPLKLSSVLLVVSFILQVISVGAPYWSAGWRRDKMSWYEGVWMTCYRADLDNKWICGAYDYSNNKHGVPGWYTFCQAMGLISLVVFLPALLINFFYTMHPKMKMFRGMRFFNFVLTFVTGLVPLLMVIVWIAGHPMKDRFPIPYRDKDYDDEPFMIHFCFVFEIFAFIISFAAFGLEVHDYRKSDYGN